MSPTIVIGSLRCKILDSFLIISLYLFIIYNKDSFEIRASCWRYFLIFFQSNLLFFKIKLNSKGLAGGKGHLIFRSLIGSFKGSTIFIII